MGSNIIPLLKFAEMESVFKGSRSPDLDKKIHHQTPQHPLHSNTSANTQTTNPNTQHSPPVKDTRVSQPQSLTIFSLTNTSQNPTLKMKANVLILALTPLVAGWNLQLWSSDGRSVSMHGTKDACNNIDFSNLKVNRLNFNRKTDWHADPNTVELFTNKGCYGLNYRNGGGNHKMTARAVRSYRIK